MDPTTTSLLHNTLHKHTYTYTRTQQHSPTLSHPLPTPIISVIHFYHILPQKKGIITSHILTASRSVHRRFSSLLGLSLSRPLASLGLWSVRKSSPRSPHHQRLSRTMLFSTSLSLRLAISATKSKMCLSQHFCSRLLLIFLLYFFSLLLLQFIH